MPEISIVLPVYNAVATVGAAIRSMLDQTFRDFELIVVDDGSDDGTSALIQSIDDPRLRLVETAHSGVAAAANRGAEEAAGTLIARMDADDRSHRRRLEVQRELLLRQGLDAVGCRVRIVDAGGAPVASMRRYERWINHETLDGDAIAALRFVELPLVNPTLLARRTYFELGFRDDDLPEDYDLMLRAAAEGARFGKAPEVLFDWVDRPGRLTRTHARYRGEAFLACRRRHLLAGPLAGCSRVDLWGAGTAGKAWLLWLQKTGREVRRLYDVHPRKVGRRIHGCRVRHCSELAVADGLPLVIAVGSEGARDIIRPQLRVRGYTIGGDAWFVA